VIEAIVIAIALAGAVAMAVRIARTRETAKAEEAVAKLRQDAANANARGGLVVFSALDELPAPVARYLHRVLADGQGYIRAVRLRQRGSLRTGTDTTRWLAFEAEHWAVPPAVGFVWNARIETPFATHVRVLDSYVGGIGAGWVSVLSILPVASAAGAPELNAGALHRYLAEAVWFPTALLPDAGVAWRAIDDHSALATLTDRNTTVSLEFRFDDAGEVTGIYTPARFGLFGGCYRQAAWEGHFSDYTQWAGMRVPSYGEVGWYDDVGALQLVWKGNILDAAYELEPLDS
jgi:hypothetical protein